MFYNTSLEPLLEKMEEKDKVYYTAKIKKYRNECGCSMGAKFIFISIFLYSWYNLKILKELSFFTTIKIVFMGIIIIFIGGLLGKLVGIFLARAKLLFVYRKLYKINLN
jgi:hypothetical protein